MEVGDRFDTSGYEIVAEIDVFEGGDPGVHSVLIMHNNSSHYLLATVACPDLREDSDATLVASVSYYKATDEEMREHYRVMLERAIEIAMMY